MGDAVELFASIRPEVIARAVEGRATLRLGLAAHTPEVAGAQLDALLDRIAGLLADRQPERCRAFVVRWVAFHLDEGFHPEDMVHSVVALGDLMVHVARRRLPVGPATAELIRDLVRAIHAMVRLVVDVVGGELDGPAARAVTVVE